MTTADLPDPPPTLKPATAAWWREIVERYEFDPFELQVLRQLGEAIDRFNAARAAVEEAGEYTVSSRGLTRVHPGLTAQRNEALLIARLTRQLRLPEEPQRENGKTTSKPYSRVG